MFEIQEKGIQAHDCIIFKLSYETCMALKLTPNGATYMHQETIHSERTTKAKHVHDGQIITQ